MNANARTPICRFDTALGACGVRWSERGIAEVLMPRTALLRDAPSAELHDVPEPIQAAIAQIVALLDGQRLDLHEIALDQDGLDDFRRAVYAAARKTGPGKTITYGQIARAIGAPESAREVGAALGSNPFPIVVPCHRVLAADGTLHGFSAPGGIQTKRRMLEIEGAPGFTQQALFA
ncbi:MAG TPA: methylated-DNA--[protein]-cysteine S-methyltransferase [Solirubrobacteraceae bacterium]|nr:methylated-DNA--[protein]-cysteine S-methyltransferase [Solirubrobacteraceae bacterium]